MLSLRKDSVNSFDTGALLWQVDFFGPLETPTENASLRSANGSSVRSRAFRSPSVSIAYDERDDAHKEPAPTTGVGRVGEGCWTKSE